MGSLVIASDLVLTAPEDLPNNPLIGWRNIVTTANIVADTADPLYPALNLANPATHLRWQAADTSEQYVTVTTGSADDNDYIGIASHNLASAQIPVSVESNDGSGFAEVVAPVVLPNDGPALFRYTPAPRQAVRLRLQSGSAPARIAVVYSGKLLVVARKLYQGFTPINMGRNSKVTNGRSETGNFLGRIVTGEWRSSSPAMSLFDPDWYRENFDPFLATGKDLPFFFSWRPQDYPQEVGYCWLTNEPAPQAQSPHNLIGLTLQMNGIV